MEVESINQAMEKCSTVYTGADNTKNFCKLKYMYL